MHTQKMWTDNSSVVYFLPALPSCRHDHAAARTGSVRFQGKQCSEHTPDYYKLYQAAEIRSRSAATRCTWMSRRRASEMFWLM